MCYLKNLGNEEQVDFDDLFAKGEEVSADASQQEANVLIPCSEKQSKAEWSEEQQMLISLFDLIQKNNHMISSLSKALGQNSQEVGKNSIQIEPKIENLFQTQSLGSRGESSEKLFNVQGKTLKEKLFGIKNYKYSIRKSSELSQTLYKQRNFNLGVELVDHEGRLIRNCNPVNLCFAICTENGEWIHENRVGEAFMKGKTEVELYKGEASFVKLYARDVSRNYSNGKVNLVVYAKPSTLLYSNSNSYEINANPNSIEPLIIEDITIKAKKKD